MFDDLWMVLPGSAQLVSPYEDHEGSRPIVAAESFTVSLVNVVVSEDFEGIFRGKNDVLVLTRSSLGGQSAVERVHAFENEAPIGKPIRNILADSVHVCEDYSGVDRLWLEVNVLEIDSDLGERKAAVGAFQSLAATAGAIFPAIVPYAFTAGAAVRVVEKLVSALERDRNVIKVPLALNPGPARPGRAPLRAGTYVAFSQVEDGEQYSLQANAEVQAGTRAPKASYAVFEVVPVRSVSPAFAVSQEVAALLTRVHQGGVAARGTADALAEVVELHSQFRKLRRYAELLAKPQRTAEEAALMKSIESMEALRPFIPTAG